MDFETAPDIQQAIIDKAQLGIYGYTIVPDAFFEAIQQWWSTQHGVWFEKEWMIFCTGIVPAISSIVRKLTTVAEQVVVLSPTYNIFYNSIINNGRNILRSELMYDRESYAIDFEDLEAKLAQPQTTLMLLCNPQNPIGKLWDKETLARIGALCQKHHVLVVSDEIHCDLCAPGKSYTPFASVNEECANLSITAISASKAFNLAGIQSACVIIPNETIRHKVNRGFNTDEIAEPNVFAIEATIAAFTKGAAWLQDLRQYIDLNKQLVVSYLQQHAPDLRVVPSEATYLVWIDCRKLTNDDEALCEFIRKETGLWVSNGSSYGNSGAGFIRMNIACPKERVLDGLQRFVAGCNAYQKKCNVGKSLKD